MAIVIDVISQLENYVITKEALEVILFDAYFIIRQINMLLRVCYKLTCVSC